MSHRPKVMLSSLILLLVATVLYLPTPAQATTWVNGDVFAAVGNSSYNVYTNGGTFKETISNPNAGLTTGCQFNPALTFLYTTTTGSRFGIIVKYADSDPHASSFFSTGSKIPESIAFRMNGEYFVGGPGSPTIQRYDSADNLMTTYSVTGAGGTGGTDWIDLAVNQTTIFYDAEGRDIRSFDIDTNMDVLFATLPGSGNAFALRLLTPFDGSGGLLVADNGNVKRLDMSGNVTQTYSITGVSGFFSLNLDPDGMTFWTGSFLNGVLYRFDIATGGLDNAIQTISTGSGNLFGVCLKGEITGGGGGAGKCPLSQGYWKNHPSAWPVTSLTIGGTTYTQAQLLDILNTPISTGKSADASLILADQLIAALLNIANGSNPVPIAATIAAAQSLLTGCNIPCGVKPSSALGQLMTADAALLDQYNNKLLTPDCAR